MRDAVVIGAGLAGLSAAWRLRHWDTVVLEAGERVGGRIRSERRGPYFLNWGGHVFSGGHSMTHELLRQTGTRSLEVPGSLSGMSMNGKLLLRGRIESYPFRIPMSMGARAAVVRAGARLGPDILRYARVAGLRRGETLEARQQRIYAFENDRSFTDYLGDLPADAAALLTPTVTRSAADPEQIAAGAGIGYFSLVWNIGTGLNRSIVGGPSTLTESIAAPLQERIELGADVGEVVDHGDHVEVRYRQGGTDRTVRARTAVIATPATIAHRIGVDLDPEVRDALSRIVYGPYVSAALLTGETERMPWDGAYGIATPKRSFNVVINPGNVVHGMRRDRLPGGSLMVFSPGSLARRLLECDDAEIRETYLSDLAQVLPGVEDHVEEIHVQRWPTGAPYCFPGRGRLQADLTRPGSRTFLAGDYLGTFYTDTAIGTGFTAAENAVGVLATSRQIRRPSTVTEQP